MTATNTGTVVNTAEIAEAYNEQGLADINSTPANKVETENDFGRADVILSVGTGGVTYVIIAIIVLAVFAVVAVLIKKEKISGIPNLNISCVVVFNLEEDFGENQYFLSIATAIIATTTLDKTVPKTNTL